MELEPVVNHLNLLGNEPFYKTEVKPPNSWRNASYNDTIHAAETLRREVIQKHPVFKMWKFNIDVQVNDAILNSLQVHNNSNISSNSHINDKTFLQKIHTMDGEFHNNSILCEILQAQSVRVRLSDNNDTNIEISDVANDLCQRCRRFQVSSLGNVCSRCEQVLTNLSI